MKDLGPLGWAKPAVGIALEGGPQMTEYHMKLIASTVDDSKFYRISPDVYEADPSLDNASPENIENLRDTSIRNAEENNEMLDKVVQDLINP